MAFLKNYFMYFLCKFGAQNWSEPFSDHILYSCIFISNFLDHEKWSKSMSQSLPDIGKNRSKSGFRHFDHENGVFHYTLSKLKMTKFLLKFMQSHSFGYWLFIIKTFLHKTVFYNFQNCTIFLVKHIWINTSIRCIIQHCTFGN